MIWPFKISFKREIHPQFQYSSDESIFEYVNAALLSRKASTVDINGDTLSFTARLFQGPRGNIFQGVNKGNFKITKKGENVILNYNIITIRFFFIEAYAFLLVYALSRGNIIIALKIFSFWFSTMSIVLYTSHREFLNSICKTLEGKEIQA